MLLFSATDLAISLASRNGTLRVTEDVNRFGDAFWAISDEAGLIEVAMSVDETEQRLQSYTVANYLRLNPASTERSLNLDRPARCIGLSDTDKRNLQAHDKADLWRV